MTNAFLCAVRLGTAGAALLLMPAAAFAEASPAVLDKADTAWVLVASLLVLFMTIPGIALFYAGMVRKKNILSTLAQSFGICMAASLLWWAAGYSIAFSSGTGFEGGLSKAFLSGVGVETLSGRIPEILFAFFQMTFAVLTPALIVGSWAERIKFSALLVFTLFWSLLVYAPVCHWVWAADGFFYRMGVFDYAGGTVVHINAGIAGLVGSLMLGRRRGFGTQALAPSNLTLAVMGASFLWFGWMGFNGGSGLAADGRAAMAIIATQIAAAAGALSWMAAEWRKRGKPSLLGLISGAVAGLVAVTPASGFVLPGAAAAIGLIAGAACFWCVAVLKMCLGYDDALDAFGVHGAGGIIGALLTGVFASSAVMGAELPSMGEQLWVQLLSVVATLGYGGAMSFVILWCIEKTIGLRVSAEEELVGLDLVLHGERLE